MPFLFAQHDDRFPDADDARLERERSGDWTGTADVPRVRREIDIDAAPQEVWRALATEDGRERWLEADPARELVVELEQEPERLVWWWWGEGEEPRRVEFEIVALPAGTRVIVVESAPSFPLLELAASLSGALALA